MTDHEKYLVRSYTSPQYQSFGKALDRYISMRIKNVQSITAWRAISVRLEVVGCKFLSQSAQTQVHLLVA